MRNGERFGVVAVELDIDVHDSLRQLVAAAISQLAIGADSEHRWTGRYASLVLRGSSDAIPEMTWQLARRVYESLLSITKNFGIGVECHASEHDARVAAELLTSKAPRPGIAIIWQRLGEMPNPPWSEVSLVDELARYPSVEGTTAAHLASAQLTTPPVRYVARESPQLHRDTDNEGFLLKDLTRHRPLSDLISERKALVLGEPWLGKTWSANWLAHELTTISPFVWKLSFSKSGESSIDRNELTEWRSSEQHGYILIDAIDEGFYRRIDVASRLRFLHAHADTPRLHVIAFARASHDTLCRQALGWSQDAKDVTWYLQPFDPDQAARALTRDDPPRGRELIARVRHHIRRLNDITLIRDFHVLSALADAERDIGHAELENIVIQALCSVRPPDDRTPVEERVRTAARIAAILHFSGVETIDLADEHPGAKRSDGSPIRLSEAFPVRGFEKGAAALERSDLLEHIPGYGYRFRQQFAKERLAAYALRDARLALIRRLVCGSRGSSLLAHRPIVERLIATNSERRPTLRQLALANIRPLPADLAMRAFERILDVSGAGRWSLRNGDMLAALAHPAVAARVLQMIRVRPSAAAQMRTAFDLAVANADAFGWEQTRETIFELAMDPDVTAELRLEAVHFICSHDASRGLRPRLDVLLNEPGIIADDAHDELARVRAVILRDRLDRGIPALEVAMVAPATDASTFDSRTALFMEIGRRLGDNEVRELLDQALDIAPRSLPEHVLSELEEGAYERWCALTWNTSDVPRIRRVLDTHVHQIDEAVARNVQSDPDLRRQVFVALADRFPYLVRLKPEDAEWLFECVSATETPHENLIREVYWYCQRDALAEPARIRLQGWLTGHAAYVEALETRIAANRADEERRAREYEDRAELNRSKTRFLPELIQEFMDAHAEPSRVIDWLGAVVFGGKHGLQQERIVGEFDDVREVLRERVMQRLVLALGLAEPFEVPSRAVNVFSSILTYEAEAFSAAVLRAGTSWLNEALVQKWLRCVLFVRADGHDAVVAACYDVATPATQKALLEALQRQVTGKDYANDVGEMPEAAMRDERFLQAALAIVATEGVQAGAREDAIFALAERVGSSLAPMLAVHTWPADAALLIAATRSYLTDGAGLGLVLAQVPSGDVPSFLEPLYRYRSPWMVPWKEWPSSVLADMASYLLERLPLESDAPRSKRMNSSLTSEIKARDLRDQVLSTLIERDDGAASEALNRFAKDDSDIAQWIARTRSARAIDRILSEFDSESHQLRPSELAVMLEDGAPARFRSDDDVYHASVEALETIASEIGGHSDLVWVKRRAGKEQNEKRLRQYLKMRIRDYLRLRAEVIEPIEEGTEKHGDRPDLVATLGFAHAVSSSTQPCNGVAIEIKWSHDRRLYSDLDKLARRYVVDQGRSNGIYAVGFTGHAGPRNCDSLRARLEKRAADLESANPGTRIGVVVLPVFRGAAAVRRSRTGRRSRSRASQSRLSR
jgi:hypothetical protein